MSDEHVIKESKGPMGQQFRVRLVDDDSPEPPYDDGSVPLWRIDARGVEQVKMTSFDASDVDIAGAVSKFGLSSLVLSRWLRIWHGVTAVQTWHSGESWYLAADTAKWREAMGVTSEQMDQESRKGSLMAEYQAWCKGDVYGYVIERRLVAYTTVVDPVTERIVGSRREDEWTQVDDGVGSLFGVYGHDHALAVAEEDFNSYVHELHVAADASRYQTITLKKD
jgi:hypothetical protein